MKYFLLKLKTVIINMLIISQVQIPEPFVRTKSPSEFLDLGRGNSSEDNSMTSVLSHLIRQRKMKAKFLK